VRRGMPKDGSAREARIRRAAPSRVTSSSGTSSRQSGAPWWHPALLLLLFAASTVAVNPDVREGDAAALAYVGSAVIVHSFALDARGVEATGPVIGPALLWSPFVLAAHAGVTVARSRGSVIPADGLSWPYVMAAALGTAVYAYVGLWLSYRMARRVATSAAALWATIAVWLASSLPVYLYLLPFAVQVAAMFSAALMLTLWLSIRDGRDARWRWLAFGLAAGLAIATSVFNAALLIVVVFEAASRIARSGGFVETVLNVMVFLVGGAVVAVPALGLERLLQDFQWSNPQWLDTAVSAGHGAFVWTPVLLLAALGCLVAIRRQPALGGTLLLAAALFFYLVAAHVDAPAEVTYGSRGLIALTPIFVWGLAALIDALAGRRGRAAWAAVSLAAALLVAWNFGMMFQWATGLLPNTGPADFRQAAINQVTVVPRAAKDSVIRYISERTRVLSGTGDGR